MPVTRLDPGPLLSRSGLMAILRGPREDHLVRTARLLVDAGIRTVEVTMNTPGALPALHALRDEFGSDVELGGGTVRTAAHVDELADVGAEFAVSPTTDSAVASRARERGLAYYPGALSPTEIERAWALGAAAVKLFPAGVGGPRYLREVLAPLDDVRIIPTGGVGPDDVGEYLRAGAVAVAMGSALVGDALEGGNPDALRARARRAVSTAAAAREGGA